ncbi:hypothetical protein [Actinomadura alba]|uniref:hypothetical protein n=1 Tax=Actinomadura alba TaxID=406431 RepID=UPI001FE7B13E|nr:hypothetical protein [Actinomadura alba]
MDTTDEAEQTLAGLVELAGRRRPRWPSADAGLRGRLDEAPGMPPPGGHPVDVRRERGWIADGLGAIPHRSTSECPPKRLQGTPAAEAMKSAVSRARRIGLLNTAFSPT